MPQIEIPFTPGQRVRTDAPFIVFDVAEMKFDLGVWMYQSPRGQWYAASELTLVESVIEWRSNGPDTRWLSKDQAWYADDNGVLAWKTYFIGQFDNPRAIAEATQKMWNEARKN